MSITNVKIHPAIGIARVGNSPDDFFIGPELPGDRSIPPGGYKDDKCRIKRQGARFRLFAYHNDGSTSEITADHADITWTVHLANKKASVGGRNPLTPTTDLIIEPSPRTLTGPNQRQAFDTGKIKFSDTPAVIVPLGEIRSDNVGRLLVLGGFGKSDSPRDPPDVIEKFYYTPGWYDDISDGPVSATVKIRSTGQTFVAEQAWVIVGPPKFAPGIDNVITLYDELLDIGVTAGWVPLTNSFYTSHIYPILERARNMKWVYDVMGAHTWRHPVIDPALRNTIFSRLKAPSTESEDGTENMPMINEGDRRNGRLTKTQYKFMQMWKDGAFVNDWIGPPSPPSEVTPQGMDQAALENAVGGAFYPGIEVGGITQCPVLEQSNYISLFRFQPWLKQGDLTAYMAIPWQADFKACGDNWWPVPRPNYVIPQGTSTYQTWDRDVGSSEDMVTSWHTLGFIVRQGDEYVEVDRCAGTFVTLLTPHLNFKDVPQGPMNMARKSTLAVLFEVKSTGGPVTLQFQSGPVHPRIKRFRSSVSIGPTIANEIVTARLAITYETGLVGEAVTDHVTIRNPADGKTWDVTITANTIDRKRTAIALVLDRSAAMNERLGNSENKHKHSQEASTVFVDTMLEGDGLAIVRFNEVADLLRGVTTIGSPIDPSHLARINAKSILKGPEFEPSGAVSLGHGIYEGHKALDASELNYDVKALLVITGSKENRERRIADVAAEINERTYAVGFGTPENINVPALQTLSSNHGGYMLVTGNIANDKYFIAQKYLLQILADINNTQFVVGRESELISGKEHSIPFYITEADMGIDVVLLAKYPEQVEFRLQTPNGFLIKPHNTTSKIHYVTSSGISYYRVVLPVELERDRLDQGGTWHAVFARRIPIEESHNGQPKVATEVEPGRGKEGEKDESFQPTPVPYSFLVHSYSNLSFKAWLRQTTYEPGGSVFLGASMEQDGASHEKGTYVWADVTRPDGTITSIVFREEEESRFSAVFNTTIPGVYQIRVRSNGRSNLGYPFQREQSLSASAWHGGDLDAK